MNGQPSTPRPEPPPVNFDAIPEELREADKWVLWGYTYDATKEKWDKPPYAVSGGLASSTDQRTWASLDTARQVYLKSREPGSRSTAPSSGVGYVVTEEDRILGVDVDGCIGPKGLSPWAACVLAMLPPTYTEVSPSGTGLRLFFRLSEPMPEGIGSRKCLNGHVPAVPGPKRPELEWYTRGRYLTITGQKWGDTPGTLAEVDAATLEAVWAYVQTLARGADKPPKPAPPPAPAVPLVESDAELLERARGFENGADFSALYDRGDTSAYGGDYSRATAALLFHLVFLTNRDKARTDRLFRSSALMRPKWDEKRGETTWGDRELDHALAEVHEGYEGRERMTQSHTARSAGNESERPALAAHELAGPPIPAAVYEEEGLPADWQRACSLLNEGHERDVFLTGLLPSAASAAPGVRTKYGRRYKALNLMTCCVAPAGSGKGTLSLAIECVEPIARRLREASKAKREAWQAMDKEERSETPEPPWITHLLSADSSSRAQTDRLRDNKGRGLLYDPEIVTVSTANRQDWGDYKPLILKGSENEPITRERKGEEPLSILDPEPCLALSGTYGGFRALIPGPEDGQFSRLLPLAFDASIVWEDQFDDSEDEELEGEIGKIARTLDKLHEVLSKRADLAERDECRPLFFYLLPGQRGTINRTFARLLQEANAAGRPELFASIKRGAFQAVRIAGVFAVYRLQASGADLSNLTSYAPTDAEVNTAAALVTCYLEHAAALALLFDADPAAKLESEERRTFFTSLPEEFTTAEAHEVGEGLGMSRSGTERALATLLERHGLISRARRGVYRKTPSLAPSETGDTGEGRISNGQLPPLPSLPSVPSGVKEVREAAGGDGHAGATPAPSLPARFTSGTRVRTPYGCGKVLSHYAENVTVHLDGHDRTTEIHPDEVRPEHQNEAPF